MTIKDINLIIGVHWNTIRKIHKKEIDEKIYKKAKYLKSNNYKPKNIAIDEFAILKGHKYATIVLNLDLGETIWIGIGRSKDCFRKFFTKEMKKHRYLIFHNTNPEFNDTNRLDKIKDTGTLEHTIELGINLSKSPDQNNVLLFAYIYDYDKKKYTKYNGSN